MVGPTIPDAYRDKVVGQQITMYDFSSIATNVVLYPWVYLAEGVVVAAGSVVTKPIGEPWTIWGGIPARKIGVRERETMLEYARRLGYD